MEIESAARRALLANSTVNGFVAGKVYRFRLGEKLDGTAGCAVVVDRNGGWATPLPDRGQEFPIVRLKCYADPDRTTEGDIARANAEDKALAVASAVNRLWHGVRSQWWGGANGVLVVSCDRRGEPVIVAEADRHGVTAGDPLGDTVYAMIEFNVVMIR